MAVREPLDEMAELSRRTITDFAETVQRLAAHRAVRNRAAAEDEASSYANQIAGAKGLADLIGRRRMLLEADAVRTRNIETLKHAERFYFLKVSSNWYLPPVDEDAIRPIMLIAPRGDSPVIPDVTFTEAVEDIISREPRLAANAEEVANVYSREHGFAVLRSNDAAITERIQVLLSKSIREGLGLPNFKEAFLQLEDWSDAYAQTVFRTNLNTAYSAGRFRQAFDPDVREVIGALEFNATDDADVRPNHFAANGFLAEVDDSRWQQIAPPLGFNCRCIVRLVDVFELERRNLLVDGRLRTQELPAQARRDQGFGGRRPDFSIYGGSAA